jgi:hypothetical protein
VVPNCVCSEVVGPDLLGGRPLGGEERGRGFADLAASGVRSGDVDEEAGLTLGREPGWVALAAQEASLRELMARMGYSGTRTALIYQHASRARERAIGSASSALIEATRPRSKAHAGGTNPESSPDPNCRLDDEGAPDRGGGALSG